MTRTKVRKACGRFASWVFYFGTDLLFVRLCRVRLDPGQTDKPLAPRLDARGMDQQCLLSRLHHRRAAAGGTDRPLRSRAIYLAGCATGTIAGCGLALFANGFWSAFLFQALAGLAVGGTYMPGLRVLTGRLTGRARIRAVPYYTTAFAVGISLSFLISGWVEARYGWRAAFLAGGAGSLFGAALALLATWGTVAQREAS